LWIHARLFPVAFVALPGEHHDGRDFVGEALPAE
jgi:hypothetical protein